MLIRMIFVFGSIGKLLFAYSNFCYLAILWSARLVLESVKLSFPVSIRSGDNGPPL